MLGPPFLPGGPSLHAAGSCGPGNGSGLMGKTDTTTYAVLRSRGTRGPSACRVRVGTIHDHKQDTRGYRMIIGIEHVSFASPDAAMVTKFFEQFGLHLTYQEDLVKDGIRTC